jgi:hypothetical protein
VKPRSKQFIKFLILALFLSIAAVYSLTPADNINKQMSSLTEVAQIGLFKKVSYKFVREKSTTNRIELKLFDSQLTSNVNEEKLARDCAKKFIQQFSAGPEYTIVDVWFINSKMPTRIKDSVFTFSRSEL